MRAGRQRSPARPAEVGRRHRIGKAASGIGKLDLDALGQRRVQPLRERRAAVARDQRGMVGAQRRVGQQLRVQPRIQRGEQVVAVLDQRHAGRQAERAQQVQRSSAQQLRKPGVEGAQLDLATAGQHAVEQGRGQRRGGARAVRV